jgi:hypothetical protein
VLYASLFHLLRYLLLIITQINTDFQNIFCYNDISQIFVIITQIHRTLNLLEVEEDEECDNTGYN